MVNMKRIAGITVLLVAIVAVTTIIDSRFLSPYNVRNVLRWTGLFGILSLGAAFVIITGGIDLSIGSVVALIGTISAYMMARQGISVFLTLITMLLLAMGLGLIHGLLVTKMRVQPFVVTLCGLFIYRGMARFVVGDMTQGYGTGFEGLKHLAKARVPLTYWPGTPPAFIVSWSIPMPFIILLILAAVLAVVLNKSVYGRHLLALGSNEPAARYSGIHTHRVIIVAYMISATFAGLGGLLFSLDLNTVQPSASGQMYELYAIAACVVGGISLRGGEGNIAGVIIGTAIVRVLYNSINIAGIATQLEFAVLGMVILIGVTVDEIVKMINEKRRVMATADPEALQKKKSTA